MVLVCKIVNSGYDFHSDKVSCIHNQVNRIVSNDLPIVVPCYLSNLSLIVTDLTNRDKQVAARKLALKLPGMMVLWRFDKYCSCIQHIRMVDTLSGTLSAMDCIMCSRDCIVVCCPTFLRSLKASCGMGYLMKHLSTVTLCWSRVQTSRGNGKYWPRLYLRRHKTLKYLYSTRRATPNLILNEVISLNFTILKWGISQTIPAMSHLLLILMPLWCCFQIHVITFDNRAIYVG